MITAVVDLVDGSLSLYVNENLLSFGTLPVSVVDISLHPSLLLGKNPTKVSSEFSGSIGAVSVSKRSLAPVQVAMLYRRGSTNATAATVIDELAFEESNGDFLSGDEPASPFAYLDAVVLRCDAPMDASSSVLIEGLNACLYPGACAPTPAVTYAPTSAPTGRPMVLNTYMTELEPKISETVLSLQWEAVVPAPSREEDSIVVLVQGGKVKDVVGNVNGVNTTVELDAFVYLAPPFVTISSPSTDPTNRMEITVVFDFSEPVYNFTRDALTSTTQVLRFGRATRSGSEMLSASNEEAQMDAERPGTRWVAVVKADEVEVSVGLLGGWVTNLAGTVLDVPPTPLRRAVDRVQPSATLSATGDEQDPAVAVFRIAFKEAVWPDSIFKQLFPPSESVVASPTPDSGLVKIWRRLRSELVVSGISLEEARALGIGATGSKGGPVYGSLSVSLTVWELRIQGSSLEDLIVSLDDSAVRDRANNTNRLSLPARFQIPDLELPRIKVSSLKGPTRVGVVPITFTFNKAILLPFPVDDVRVSLQAVRPMNNISAARIPIKITNLRQTDLLVFVGDVAVNTTVLELGLDSVALGGQWGLTVQVPEGVLKATTGQRNFASNEFKIIVDVTPPTVTITSDTLYTLPLEPGRPVVHIVPFTFTFNEDVEPTIPPGGLLKYINVRGLGGAAVSSSQDDTPELGAPPIVLSDSFNIEKMEWQLNVSAVSGDMLSIFLASKSCADAAGWANVQSTPLSQHRTAQCYHFIAPSQHSIAQSLYRT
jgi:hypothetical protein